MKNQLLFLFALLVISKAQTVGEAIVGILTNEEEGVITVSAGEEPLVTISNNEENLNVNEEGLILVNEENNLLTPAPVIAALFPNTVINTTHVAGPTLTIQAPPIPPNVSVPADSAQNDLSDTADALDNVSGAVVITNSDGTVSVVDASDLADELHNQAKGLDGATGNVTIPGGGDVQFIPLNALPSGCGFC